MRGTETMTINPVEGEEFEASRVVRLTAVLVAIGAIAELAIWRSIPGALSLTLAGAVAIINFRWLDVVLQRVLQPGQPRYDSGSVVRIFARLSLLAVVFAAILLVPSVDAVAVALGFSALVVALIVEGLRGARLGGG